MGRPVVLSNGQMFVGLNKDGLVHDFYYPYVGLNNLTTTRSERHKIGVWVDGVFSWVNEGGWDNTIDFESDALISKLTLRNEGLGITLESRDFVDSSVNAFCRQITVKSDSDQPREVRVFMHQVFQISHDGHADTALYEADGNYLLDYKGRCTLLAYAESSSGEPFNQYAVGNYNMEGKEGTFRDAEDGELSGNAVEHGGVDSVIGVHLTVSASSPQQCNYWIVAAESQKEAEDIHDIIKDQGLQSRLENTVAHWAEWMAPAASKLKDIRPEHLEMTKKSLLIIKAHTDKRGGILASGDSSIFNYGRDYYGYCWPRDGAYAVWPLLRLGITGEAKNFFNFCRDVLNDRGYLMHKYQPDRAIGSTWHPTIHRKRHELAIQEDETAIVLVMLSEYFELSGDREYIELMYPTLIKPAAQFMTGFFDEQTNLPHATYDLWEEKFLTSTYTVAVTYAALTAAAQFADMFGYAEDALEWSTAAARISDNLTLLFDEERQILRKGFLLEQDGSISFDNTLDVSSMYGMMAFGPHHTQPMVDKTFAAIESTLFPASPAGGLVRYEYDNYMRTNDQSLGNPWFICTFWAAQYYLANKNLSAVDSIMEWAGKLTTSSGIMSEQINPESGSQVGVSPLVWSHAEYINIALDIAEI